MFYEIGSILALDGAEITLAGIVGTLKKGSGKGEDLHFSYKGAYGDVCYCMLGTYNRHAGDCGAVSPQSSGEYVFCRDIVNDFFARQGIARIHVVLSQNQHGFTDAVVGGKFGVGGKVVNCYECNSTRKGKDHEFKLRHFIVDLTEHPNFRYGYLSRAHFLNPQGA